jgi:hypothetical protein
LAEIAADVRIVVLGNRQEEVTECCETLATSLSTPNSVEFGVRGYKTSGVNLIDAALDSDSTEIQNRAEANAAKFCTSLRDG